MQNISRGKKKRFDQNRSISHYFFILSAVAFFSMIKGVIGPAQAATFKIFNSECAIEAENWTSREGSTCGQWRVESRESGYIGYGDPDCSYALAYTCSQDPGISPDTTIGASDANINLIVVGIVSPERNILVTDNKGSVNDEDNDAVDDEEEDGVSLSGDGNDDGTADRFQSHVASMRTLSGEYVTLVAPTGSRLVDCRMLDSPSPNNAPADVIFPQGFIDFTISGLENPDDVTLEIILHSSEAPTNYYKYGPTPDDTSDHWYEFLFDDETGAEMNGNVITLHFTDAKRGDDVLEADDMIIGIGGAAYKDDDAGTGQSTACFISSMF